MPNYLPDITQLEKLSQTFNMEALDLGKTLEATLKLEDDSINIQEVMNSCSKSETLFSAFKIEQDTEIEIAGNFSFASLKAEVNKVSIQFILRIEISLIT